MRTGKAFPWITIPLLLLASAAGLYHIQTQSLWFDEGWSAYAAVQPTLVAAWNADTTNPPLYYLLLNIFVRGAGDSELALRYFSLLWGLIVIALVYQLGRRLFNSRAGSMSALLVALSPLLWWAAQEARMYTLLAGLLFVCALVWHELRRRPAWYWWLALWGAELALLYAHNTGPVVALWLNVVTVLTWMLRRGGFQPRLFPTPYLWFGGQFIVGLLWLPYFVNRFVLLSGANNAVNSTSPFTVDMLARLWQVLWSGAWTMVGYEPLLVILSAVILFIALLLIPWRASAARWLVLHVIILTAGLWLGLSVLGNEIHGRYLVMIAPLLLVALGAGLAHFTLKQPENDTTRGLSPLFNQRFRIIQIPFVIPFTVTFLTAIHFVTTNPAYQHDDARGMVQYYAQNLTADDSVLMWSYADRYEMAYYWERLGVQAQRIRLPEGADLEAVLPLLPDTGDVALNIWYTQRADYRGMMGCLLGDGTVNEPEAINFYGMTNRLFRAPPLRPLNLKPFQATLSMATLSALGEIKPAPADQAICLPVQITLTQPTSVDLKAAVRVLNRYGWEIARSDAIFADRIQRTTSQLPLGSVLTAYPLLRLPYGAPPDQYTVQIRIYDEQVQPTGYSLTMADGQTRPDVLLGMQRITGSDWAKVTPPENLSLSAAGHQLGVSNVSLNATTLSNSAILQMSILWQGTGTLPPLSLSDPQAGWRSEIPAPDCAGGDTIRLDWRTVQIPPDAPSGTAYLALPDETVISTLNIEATPLIKTLPVFDSAVNADIPGIATLMGYSVQGDMTDRSQPFEVSLVWQAQQATAISYTVFVQLVSSDGRVLAQSDSLPARQTRPTTGWRRGEYIVDSHTVTFYADATPGSARLIVGLYDAASGQRVTVTAASDFITLQENIAVR